MAKMVECQECPATFDPEILGSAKGWMPNYSGIGKLNWWCPECKKKTCQCSLCSGKKVVS